VAKIRENSRLAAGRRNYARASQAPAGYKYYSKLIKDEAELGLVCAANKQGIARPLEHYMKTNKIRWINTAHPRHDFIEADKSIGKLRKQIRMIKTLSDHSRTAVTKLRRLSRREGCLLSMIRKGFLELPHRLKLFLDCGFHGRMELYNAHFRSEGWVPWRAPAGLVRCLRILDSTAAMQPHRRENTAIFNKESPPRFSVEIFSKKFQEKIGKSVH